MKRSIILIGFMGSGKTTMGLRLSYRLKTPVEDIDRLIEHKEGRNISDIFRDDGEEYFRDRETEVLREMSLRKYVRIISAGGGTPLRKENRELLKKCGFVVYLRVRPETVYERLKGDTTRPLLACENPLDRIRELMDDREEAYVESADIILDVDDMCADDIVENITCKIRGLK